MDKITRVVPEYVPPTQKEVAIRVFKYAVFLFIFSIILDLIVFPESRVTYGDAGFALLMSMVFVHFDIKREKKWFEDDNAKR